MKKSFYLLVALAVISNTTFAETTLTEEIYNTQTEVLSEVIIPQGLASVFLSLGTKFAIFSIKSMATH